MTALAGWGHEARRLPPVVDEGPLGPWLARVQVIPIEMNRARSSGATSPISYEVLATWHGPPAYGFPPSLTYVDAEDKWVTDDLGLAKRMAARVIAELRAADDVPDMRTIVREWRAAGEASGATI